MPELYQINTGALAAAQMKGVETKANDLAVFLGKYV